MLFWTICHVQKKGSSEKGSWRKAPEGLQQATVKSEISSANSYALPYFSVGVDAHIDPAECTVSYENLRPQIFGEFVTSKWADRVCNQSGLDKSRPQNVLILCCFSANSLLPSGPMWASAPTTECAGASEFAENFCKNTAAQRAEQGPAPTSIVRILGCSGICCV